MSLPTLASLVAGVSFEDSLAQEFQIAADLGLPTTSWQPIQAVVSIFNVEATIISDASQTIAFIAQGGYASYAALMVDSSGNPVTEWLDLISSDTYQNIRVPATFADGNVPLINSGVTSYPYGPTNPLHAQHPVTGATYTSQGTGTVAGSTTTNVDFRADQPGTEATAGIGVVLTLTTPLANVSCGALLAPIVGGNEESNAALLSRDQAKLGTLGNGGPSQAYDFVARSIPQGTPSSSPPYAVSSPITRTKVWLDTGSGDVFLYIANAGGAPSGTDIGVVNAAIQALVVPDGVTADVLPVIKVPIVLSVNVYVRSAGSQPSNIIAGNIDDALANYAATLPIGGVSTSSPNIVPLSELTEVIFGANPGTVDVVILVPTTPPGLGQSGVPTFTVGVNVFYV